MKRSIRLKEHVPGQVRNMRPSAAQLSQCPDLGNFDYRLATDSNGFIVSGHDPDVDMVTTTVVTGDSFVESTFVAEPDRFCSLLERLDFARQGKVFGRVLNAGVSGSTSLNILNCVLNKVVAIAPARVIFVLPSNDAAVHRFINTYWNDSEYYSNIVPSPARDRVGGFDENLRKPDFIKVIEILRKVCDVFSIELVLATCPFAGRYEGAYMESKYKTRGWFEANVRARKYLNEALRSVALSGTVQLVDLEAELGGDNLYFYDDLHLNKLGSVKVADVIYRQVVQSFMPD